MVDWYRIAEGMYRDGDISVGRGEIQIGRSFLLVLCLLLAAAIGNHFLRLSLGATSWLGYVERNVREAPGWMHSPISNNMLSDDFGLSAPLLARKGQEIVVHYSLSSQHATTESPRATIFVTCFCPDDSRMWFRVEGPKEGETSFTVPMSGWYSIDVRQSGGPDGEASVGTFYWGLRNPPITATGTE
jgi:hypothetical protein